LRELRNFSRMCDLEAYLGGVRGRNYYPDENAAPFLILPSIEEDCADCPLVLYFETEPSEDEAARRIQKAWKRFSNPKKLVVVMKTTTTKSYSVVDGEVFGLNETTEKECTVYVRDKQGDVPLGHWNY
jgi:hypothetical protein